MVRNEILDTIATKERPYYKISDYVNPPQIKINIGLKKFHIGSI